MSHSDRGWPDREGETELVVRHSAFRTTGDQTARCEMCGWVHRGSQSAVTAAARRHVKAHRDHEVWTTRVQQKVTRVKRATVLR